MNINPTAVDQLDRYGGTKRSVLRNLLISMLSFGILVGFIFPPFASIVLETDRAYTPLFFSMCVLAGFLVGIVNFQIFRVVVSRELERIRGGMKNVLSSVIEYEHGGEECGEDCILSITSADILGDITLSFNEMTRAISTRLKLEGDARSINANLTTSVELEDVSKTILRSLAGVLNAKGGVLFGGIEGEMNLLADFGIDKIDKVETQIGDDSGPVNHAMSSGEILSFSPDQDSLEWMSQSTPLGKFKPKSVILVPLRAKQRTVGIVALASNTGKPTDGQFESIEAIRSYGAPYLDNAILHQRIKNLAALDDLTMILNRRFGLRRLREEFSRGVRHGVPVSVLMLDVDHFKDFNDTYGHDAGDAVLKMVASRIEGSIRAGDMICRYGGEEFMAVAPGTGMNDAATFADRIRRMIETSELIWGEQRLSVTVSIGVATWPIARASVSDELISSADRALYAAKDFGRNQVAVLRGDEIVPMSALDMEKPAEPEEEKT